MESDRHERRVVVGVTGAASGVGLAVVRRLGRAPRVRGVVALDAVRVDLVGVPGVLWRTGVVTDPGLATRLSGVDAVVHPVTPGADALPVATAVLGAAAAAGVPRVVLVTAAAVYGALPDNERPLPEDAPLRARADAPEVEGLLEVEALAARAPGQHPGLAVTVVRPAALVGPGIDTPVAGHFTGHRLLVVRGTHPCWQFCHVDDLADALVPAVLGRAAGVLTVGCEGALEQEEVEALTGLRRIELPATLAVSTAERLHRLGLLPGPAPDLSSLVHPVVVPSTRLREVGWTPAYDNAAVLGLLLEQHARGGGGGRDARVGAAGAAGAAVALVGTAALVRRARARRRG